MRRALDIAAMILVLAGLGFSQDPAARDRETIQLLVHQVQELQEKVKALEARTSVTEAITQEAPVEAPSSEKISTSTPESHQILWAQHGIQWRGFAEVNYKVLNQRQPELGAFGFVAGSAGNFYIGDFDLFLTSRINDHASVLAEIVFGEGDAQSFDVDLERALVKYDYDDHLKMSFGRYHTDVGYYNTAFHSGKWLQTTADRPLVMEFAAEGGLLPTQAVGVQVTGLVPSGKLGLNYLFEYGSSDTIRPELGGTGISDDENNGNHINIGFFARPEAFPGLQVGGAFYHDKISEAESESNLRLSQSIVNGYVVYVAHGIEFLNEGFLIRHSREHSEVTFNMPAFYSQFSRKFGSIRPFFRYQYVNANVNSMFDDVLLRHGPSFGVRYDFNENIAFKTQLDHTLRKGQADLNGLQMQLAVTF